MELVLLLPQHEVDPPPDGLRPPRAPLLQKLAHAQHSRHPADKHVEVAAARVLQSGLAEELCHQLGGVRAPLEVDGQLQAGAVRLVPHVGDLPDLSRLDELRHLVEDGVGVGGIGDLVDLDQVPLFDVAPSGPHLHAAAPGAVDLLQRRRVADQLAAGGKVGGEERVRQGAVRIFQIRGGGLADLLQVEAAELGGHAHGDAAVGGDEDIGERGGQERRLLHGVVVVIHKVHRVVVDVPEDLSADGRELCLRVPAGGVSVLGIDLAEVALGVHKGSQQRAVPRAQAHHRVVNGGVAVGIETHGLAHDVGGLGPRPGQKAHFVHGVEQLPVGGLEPVDLRDGPGDDDAHGVGHIVDFQRVGDGLGHHGGLQALDVGVRRPVAGCFRLVFLRHSSIVPLLMRRAAPRSGVS